MYGAILAVVVVIIIIIAIIWLAYAVTAAYQQTLTITVPFQNTYRYVPTLNADHKYELNSIKITVTGSIKRNTSSISRSGLIKKLVEDNITQPHTNCVLVHEAQTFAIQEDVLKRSPIIKDPTLENLSVIFFNKLAPLMPNIGCQLVSVKLTSEGNAITHSRYKISDYKM